MNNLISKLNALKSIEPEENWVIETRKRVLSETPVLGWKVTEIKSRRENTMADKFFSRRDADLSRLCEYDELRCDERRDELRRDESPSLRHIYARLFSKRLAVSAFAIVFMISGGAFTVEASKSSLPGDVLYSVKIATENATLAITPEDKKAEVEVEHAGKRVEEIVEISKKTSDIEQQKKLAQLVEKFDEKMNSANNRLANTSGNGEKAKVAKVINTQSKKYIEVLTEITENLPEVVKDEIKVAEAIDLSEKINLTSLTVMVKEMTDEDKEEITAIVKEKAEEGIIEDKESTEDTGTEEGFDESDSTDQAVIETETEENTDSEDNTENSVEESEETELTTEDTKKELLGILDDLNNPDDSEGEELRGDEEDKVTTEENADLEEEILK